MTDQRLQNVSTPHFDTGDHDHCCIPLRCLIHAYSIRKLEKKNSPIVYQNANMLLYFFSIHGNNWSQELSPQIHNKERRRKCKYIEESTQTRSQQENKIQKQRGQSTKPKTEHRHNHETTQRTNKQTNKHTQTHTQIHTRTDAQPRPHTCAHIHSDSSHAHINTRARRRIHVFTNRKLA